MAQAVRLAEAGVLAPVEPAAAQALAEGLPAAEPGLPAPSQVPQTAG